MHHGVRPASAWIGGTAMILTVFGTTYRDDADMEREARLSRRMAQVACRKPGFISYKSYVAPDGEQIGIIRFESREALKGWRDDVAHQRARFQMTPGDVLAALDAEVATTDAGRATEESADTGA